MRLFVAVWPDDPTRDRLAALPLGSTEGLRRVRQDQWHVTLRFLGDVDAGLVPALADSLRGAAGALPGARCEVGPSTAWFSGGRVLQIPARGLERAAAAVREATQPIVPDVRHDIPRFTGHVTLARTRRRVVDRAALAEIPFDAIFDVGSFDLVRSELTENGPEYTTLARLRMAR